MQTESPTFTKIDIRQLLQTKVPKLEKFVPAWLVRALARLLHLDEINEFLTKSFALDPIAFVHECNQFLALSTEVIGEQLLADYLTQRPIIIANHPLGGPESIALLKIMSSYGIETKLVSNAILTHLKPLEPLLIPIPVRGDRLSVQEFRDNFASDSAIIIFPAGYCSRPLSNGVIFDYQWHFTCIKMAKKYNRPIIPVHIDGVNSKKFYRLSAIRKALRIKMSLESLYLPDEMFKQRGKHITYTIGQIIEPAIFDDSVNNCTWADRLRNHVYILGKESSQVFNPETPLQLPAK